MKLLLKLKHWQLFMITWGLPMLANTITFSRPEIMLPLFPVLMLFFSLGTFGWIWAIATGLNPLLAEGIQLNVRKFKVLFVLPILYILFVVALLGLGMRGMVPAPADLSPATLAGIIVPLHLLSMIIIFWGIRFAAKTLKSAELGRRARFGEYAAEFFLIWFSLAGYWVLQPRINKLAGQLPKANLSY